MLVSQSETLVHTTEQWFALVKWACCNNIISVAFKEAKKGQVYCTDLRKFVEADIVTTSISVARLGSDC